MAENAYRKNNEITLLLPVTLRVNNNIEPIPHTREIECEEWKTMIQAVKDRLDHCQRDLLAHREEIGQIDHHGIYYRGGHYSFIAAKAMEQILKAQLGDDSPAEALKHWSNDMLLQCMKATPITNVWWDYAACTLLHRVKEGQT